MKSLPLYPTPDLDAIIDRMDERLRLFAHERDHRERFLLMYRTFKVELRTNIQAGRFLDVAWTEAICCRMCEMYFEADDAYTRMRARCPEPWRHCFDSATAGRTNLLQDMLLGMNAHINYDLPLCTYDTFEKFGDLERARAEPGHADLMFDTTLKQRYLDYLMINQIAWESIPLIQDIALDRFSKLLKLGNMLSLRLTKYLAETIIVDHRDRAWAHTMLMATVQDPEEIQVINRLTTRFAMEAATLVAWLTLNPLTLMAAIKNRTTRSFDPGQTDVVLLLVENLRTHLTARAARRALVEYGPAIQPILEQIVDQHPPDTLRLEMVKIMAQHPSPAVAQALYRQLDPTAGKSYELALHHLAMMRRKGIGLTIDKQNFRASVEQEATRARQYYDHLHTLGVQTQESVLGETLRIRFGNSVRRILYLTSIMYPNQGLMTVAAVIGQGCATLAPDAVIEVLQTALPIEERTLTLLDVHQSDRRSSEIMAGSLPKDPWLEACVEYQSAAIASVDSDGSPDDDSAVQESAMLSTVEKVLYLKNCELFRDIPSEDLAQIAGLARRIRFRNGEVLIEEGKPGEALYIILDGEIDVTAEPGRRLARVGRNAVLGEMSLLSEMLCSATCTATSHGHALRISRMDFLPFLLDYPEISAALIQVLIQRLRQANLRIQEPLHEPASGSIVLPGTWSP